MAKKSFRERARLSITEPQALSEERSVPTSTRGEYEGTTRLREARNISIEKIRPDPHQPRKTFAEEPLDGLAASIRVHGVLQPITVEYVEDGDYFQIISGERRYRAALKAGLPHLPCVVRTTDHEKRLAHQLIENIQREDLSPIDKARGLLELKAALGKDMPWNKVEEITGISERRRKQFLALLNLPESIQKEIVALGRRPARNQVTEKHARALLRLKEYPDQQVKLLNRIKDSKHPITGDEALLLAREIKGTDEKPLHKMTFTYTTHEDLIAQLKAKLAELRSSQQQGGT